MKKSGVSVFFLEILYTFLYYANEEGDDLTRSAK